MVPEVRNILLKYPFVCTYVTRSVCRLVLSIPEVGLASTRSHGTYFLFRETLPRSAAAHVSCFPSLRSHQKPDAHTHPNRVLHVRLHFSFIVFAVLRRVQQRTRTGVRLLLGRELELRRSALAERGGHVPGVSVLRPRSGRKVHRETGKVLEGCSWVC